MIDSTYPTYFADPKRGCAVSVTSDAKGLVVWEKELDSSNENTPIALLLWQECIVVDANTDITVYQNDGTLLFSHRKFPGLASAVANNFLHYVSNECFLNLVNTQNEEIVEDAPFPISRNHGDIVSLLWPGEETCITVVFWPGFGDDSKPQISWREFEIGEISAEQSGVLIGKQTLSPLYIPELNRIAIAMDEVVCFDVKQDKGLLRLQKGDSNQQEKTARFKFPMDKPLQWSSDADGLLCIAGYDDSSKVLVGISHTGQEKWRWTDSEKPDKWITTQPPIRFGSQRVYALTGSRVLAIEQGKLLWQYEVKDETLRHGSSLADGSLLVTAGKTLINLDSTGNERFIVSLEDEILTPPVADADGNIYVATASHLVQIK